MSFTSEIAGALAGPSWLKSRRLAAASRFASAELPTEQDDDWHYGLVDELDLARFALVDATDAQAVVQSAAPQTVALLKSLGECAVLVRAVDGLIVELDVSTQAAELGVTVSSSSELTAAPEGFGNQLGVVPEAFAAMADGFMTEAVVISVPADIELVLPIVVIQECSAASAGRAIFPRSFIEVGARAEASVVELFVSGEEECLVVPVTEIEVGEEADLAYHAIQQLGVKAWQLGYQLSRVGREGVIRSFSAGLGGAYARLYTRADLYADGAESELSAVYLATGTQVQDFRTFQEHVAPRTKSRLIFKGAVDDHARSVYTGLIHMHKGARRADAAQTNRNLVLSEGAHADSVPNLDIEENDVRCSHASAVGPIDADQRFYLESRGISPEVAERLILLGFFEDLLARVPTPGCARYLSEVITARLAVIGGRNSGDGTR